MLVCDLRRRPGTMTEDARRLVFFVMEERFEGEDEVCLAVIVGMYFCRLVDQFVSILTEPILLLVDRGGSFKPRNIRNSDLNAARAISCRDHR